MVDLVFADDHPFAAEGLRFFLSTVEGMNVVDIVTNGHDVDASLERHKPDILVLDMGLPGRHGLEVLKDIKRSERGVRVIVLTGLDAMDLLNDAIVFGADAVLTKSADTDEILTAIQRVIEGQRYIGKSVAKKLHGPQATEGGDETATLTIREKEVLLNIASGCTSTQIARIMDISEATVRKHRQNLMSKLKLHNAAEITAYVLRRGLNL